MHHTFYNTNKNLPSDKDILIKLQEKIKYKKNIVFIKNSNNILKILNNIDILIGMRLHSLIFSTITHTPMIGIKYHPKVNGYLKYINLEKFSIDPLNINPIEIIQKIEDIKSNNNASIYLQKMCLKLKLYEKRNIFLLKKILRDPHYEIH